MQLPPTIKPRFKPSEALAKVAEGGLVHAPVSEPEPSDLELKLYTSARAGGKDKTAALVLAALENERRLNFASTITELLGDTKVNNTQNTSADDAHLASALDDSLGQHTITLFDALAVANKALVQAQGVRKGVVGSVVYGGAEYKVGVQASELGVIVVRTQRPADQVRDVRYLPWAAGIWREGYLIGVKALVRLSGDPEGGGNWYTPEALALLVADLPDTAVWHLNGKECRQAIPATGIYGNITPDTGA